MKDFLANDTIAHTCFNKFKYKAALIFLLFTAFIIFEVFYDFHKHYEPLFIFFITILGAVVWGIFIFSVYNGIMRINMILRKVEIDGSRIVFETFGATMLFNLIKRDPVVMSMQADQAKFALSTNKYSFDAKYSGNIYLLVFANDEYLIMEKFFENFSELKAVFQNFNEGHHER